MKPQSSKIFSLARRNWRSIFIALALLTDTLAIGASCAAALHLRRLLPHTAVDESAIILQSLFFWAIVVLCGLAVGLYRGVYRINLRQQYVLATKAWICAFLIFIALFYVLQHFIFPRTFTFLFFLLLPILFVVGRSLLSQFNLRMQKKGLGISNALIFGYRNGGVEIFRRFRQFPELGYDIKGVVSEANDSEVPGAQKDNLLTSRCSLSALNDVVQRENIDIIFIPSHTSVADSFAHLLELCRKESVRLKVASPEADQLLRMARVYDTVGITLYSPPRFKVEYVKKVVKRFFDTAGSLLAILVLLPIFMVAGAAIWIESGWPVIFKHRRSATKGGPDFYFYKFRSMIKGADEMKGDLVQSSETDGALFKLRSDPRMTKVGKIIRRFSIDELPQLFNVLKGDMSLVGPRPLPIRDFEKVSEAEDIWEAVREREKVKPGITGLWQISGRSNVGFKEMVLLDLYYIENQSPLFDLEILFETIPVVLFGKGAY